MEKIKEFLVSFSLTVFIWMLCIIVISEATGLDKGGIVILLSVLIAPFIGIGITDFIYKPKQ